MLHSVQKLVKHRGNANAAELAPFRTTKFKGIHRQAMAQHELRTLLSLFAQAARIAGGENLTRSRGAVQLAKRCAVRGGIVPRGCGARRRGAPTITKVPFS